MIISITVNDNDFTSTLEEFILSKIQLGDKFKDSLAEGNFKEEEKEEMLDTFKMDRKIATLKTEPSNISGIGQLKLVEDYYKRLFKYYVEKYVAKSNKDYLLKNVDIKTSFTYEDKWENGEVVYYFVKTKMVFSQ